MLSLCLLAACTPAATGTPAVASEISPTETASLVTQAPATRQSTAGVTSTAIIQAETPRPPEATPAPSATPQLSPVLSAAAIQLLSPGPLSMVLSPVNLRGYILPGYRNMIRVELIGEDGRLVFRKLMQVYTEYKWAYFTVEIPFETRAAAELGRLQVSTEDEHGNTTALLGVHLLLQPQGYAEINPPGNLDERCTLFTPLAGMDANGGILEVSGQYQPLNTQPLILELVDASGSILANSWVTIPETNDGSPVAFGVELVYGVDEPTPVLLVARQWDARIAGNMYLFSRPMVLNP